MKFKYFIHKNCFVRTRSFSFLAKRKLFCLHLGVMAAILVVKRTVPTFLAKGNAFGITVETSLKKSSLFRTTTFVVHRNHVPKSHGPLLTLTKRIPSQ